MNSDQISGRQLQRIHIALGDLGVTDRDAKLRALSAVLYRPLTSSKDITAGEATVVLATLRDLDRDGLRRMTEQAEARMATP